MRRTERRTETYQVHIGIYLPDKTALQTGMHHLHQCLFVEHFLIDFHHLCRNLRIEIRLPCPVTATEFHLHARHVEATFQHGSDIVHHALARTACQNQHFRTFRRHVDNRQIGRGLHDVRNGRDVAKYTVMTSHNGIQHIVLNVFRHLGSRQIHALHRHHDVFFHPAVFFGKHFRTIFHQSLQLIDIIDRYRHHRFALTRYGIAHIAPLPRSQTRFVLTNGHIQEPRHQFVGIGTPLANLQTGMSAAQTFDRHSNRHVSRICLHGFIGNRCRDVHPSGTSYHKFAHRLVVEVQQDVARQRVGRKMVDPVHASFLVGCNQCLQRAVLQALVFHHGHNGRHPHSVVRAQGRPLGFHPLAVDVGFDGVGLKIMPALRRLLRHHVHMGLHDGFFAVLHPRRGGLAHDDVLALVLKSLYTVRSRPIQQELLHFLQMSRRTRNAGQRMEILPYDLRFQVLNLVHNNLYYGSTIQFIPFRPPLRPSTSGG